MDKVEAGSLLRRTGWLSQTPEDFQALWLGRCDMLTLAAGDTLYRAGDAAGGLFGIVDGLVELHFTQHGDMPTLGHCMGPGMWFGDLAAVDGRTRRLSIVAATASQVMRMPRTEMLRLCQSHPYGWQAVAQLLARNLETAIEVVGALRRADPAERVATLLVNLIDSVPSEPGVVRASQTAIGAMTQLGRSSVNAALASLERRGLVRRGYAVIEVPDVQRLRHFIRGE